MFMGYSGIFDKNRLGLPKKIDLIGWFVKTFECKIFEELFGKEHHAR